MRQKISGKVVCNTTLLSFISIWVKRSCLYISAFGQLRKAYRKKVRMENKRGMSVRKGPWTYEEDNLLKAYIHKYGQGKWHLIPKRTGIMIVACTTSVFLINSVECCITLIF